MLTFGTEYFVFYLSFQKFKFKIYISIIFPAVVYVCETWSLTLREVDMMRVLEKRALRRIFGPKRD